MIGYEKKKVKPAKEKRVLVRFKNPQEKLGAELTRANPDPRAQKLYVKTRERRLGHIARIVDKKKGEFKDKYGIEPERAYRETPTFLCSVSTKVLKELKKDPGIQEVVEDGIVEVMGQEVPWGIERVGAIAVHGMSKGKGVKVCVMDTGIDQTHPDLSANYKGGYNVIIPGTDPVDGHGHGTWCAGIIAAIDNDVGVIGVAPEASLYAVKVLNDAGWGYWSWAIEGMEWCIANKMQIVSMSFGGLRDPGQAIKDVMDAAYSDGILLFAAAGNEGNGRDTVTYPARYDSVIAVAAIDENNQRAYFSCTGPSVELSAPGVNVKSCFPNNQYKIWSGTSAACPHGSGVAALILAVNPLITNVWIRQWLQEKAIDLGEPGRDWYYGYGLITAVIVILKMAISPLVSHVAAGKLLEYWFETRFHHSWFLKTQQKYGKTQEIKFETEFSPEWFLKTQQKYGKAQELSFITELSPLWSLKVEAKGKKYYQLSFKTIFDPKDERLGPPRLELYKKDLYGKPILTVPVNWLKKGVQRVMDFELWYGRNQNKPIVDNVVLTARKIANVNKGGKEIIDNDWFKVRKKGIGEYLPVKDFNCDRIEAHSYQDLEFLFDVPGDAVSMGIILFVLGVFGTKRSMMGDIPHGLVPYAASVFAKTDIVFRVHIMQ